MMLFENISLKQFNTFGIDVAARYLAICNSLEDIEKTLANKKLKKLPLLILGGGSNVLFTQDIDAVVIKPDIKGIKLIDENKDFVWIKVGCGEEWHNLVMHCIENNWGGIENLSLIPGNCGAAPMQNIGAYGVELKDVFVSLEALDLEDGKLETFSNKECKFGYRTSIFKTTHKGLYIITSITLKLSKKHKINTSYGAIEEELKKMNCSNPTIKDVSNAVIAIRQSKLPNPTEIGNAGSFFKNPEISNEAFEALKIKFPDIPGYPINKKYTKVPAAWLIEKSGLKGKKFGNYGVHDKQALVLVNYGGAKGADIYQLSEEIRNIVYENFGIELEREVNIF